MSGRVAYSSPFVPAEWIAAHGLMPRRITVQADEGIPAAGAGVCAYAWAFAQLSLGGAGDGIIVTSTCDQMRRVAERIESAAGPSVFLMNVPSTWQSSTAREVYAEELQRLSRFLVRLWGTRPDQQRLREIMERYQRMRQLLRERARSVGAAEWARGVMEFWETGAAPADAPAGGIAASIAAGIAAAAQGTRNIAIAGGPLRRQDLWLLELIESAGGRIVLDATETGERVFPGEFDPEAMRADPLKELARAYFQVIPDAFRRPDTLLHEYLQRECRARQVRGIVMVRYAWCDQWHAQFPRLKELGLPVIDIDLGEEADRQRGRTRIESLLSILS